MKALGHIGCAVLVACLAPFGGFAAEGASAAGPLKVGVYADDGASGIGAIEWFRLVHDSPAQTPSVMVKIRQVSW